MSDSATVVRKLWNYCSVLRDDGLSYQDYLEQLTFLLFLKMDDEQSKPPLNRPPLVPTQVNWEKLSRLDGDELDLQYRHTLTELGRQPGTLGVIFRRAQNKIQDPAKLRKLIYDLIGSENWMSMDADIKGDAYDGILARNAEDTKSGAGQYFTPRPLIRAIVDVMRPGVGDRICDPAAGTGGFLLAAFEYMKNHPLDPDQKLFLRDEALRGWELVAETARLCAMNLLLHGIGTPAGSSPITVRDALQSLPNERFDIVLTNPPFGTRSSIKIINAQGDEESENITYLREDFWVTTKNKQLNFVQHVHSLLKINGLAAVVVPDNVLYEGGAGETVRRRLLQQSDLHTILRLPKGIFYKPGVKANVLFFDRKPPSEQPWTETIWIYDLRTNRHFTLKDNPLQRADLDDFVACYNPDNRHERTETARFHPLTYEELVSRDKANFDVFWLRDESLEDTDNLPAPHVLAAEIVEDLEEALAQFSSIAETLRGR